MQLKLKVTAGKHAGQEISVPGPKFLIGRAEDCQLRAGSEAISRHHCVIMIDEGYIGVRDFGSKNGTFVNDQRVVGERPLKTQDVLRVGPLQFEIKVDHRVGGKKRSKVNDVGEVAARITAEPQPSQSDADIDISDWLDDGESTSDNATIDTQVGIALNDDDLGDPNDTQVSRQDEAEPSKPKFEMPAPDKPVDSRTAAITMLRKMQELKRDQSQKK